MQLVRTILPTPLGDMLALSSDEGLCALEFTTVKGRASGEERLSRLCYWVLELSQRHQPFALRLPGFLSTVDSGDAHREACLRALALYGHRS